MSLLSSSSQSIVALSSAPALILSTRLQRAKRSSLRSFSAVRLLTVSAFQGRLLSRNPALAPFNRQIIESAPSSAPPILYITTRNDSVKTRQIMDSNTSTHATATSLPLSTTQPTQVPTSTEPQQPDFFTAATSSHPDPPQITDRAPQQSRPQFVDEGTDPLPPTPLDMPAPALLRSETTEPIGPSTDLPTPMPQTPGFGAPSGPVITINLLLSSTGTRHPYRIDQKYLAKRNVTAENESGEFDPFVISVYTLKELIWRDWREGMSY